MIPKPTLSNPAYWVTGALALAVVGTWTAYGLFQPRSSTSTVAATTAPAPAVTALGRIEPKGSVIKLSVANAQDSRVDQLLVKEGDRVKAGQVIAVLQGLDKKQAALEEARQQAIVEVAKLRQTQSGDTTMSDVVAQQAVIRELQAELTTELQVKQAEVDSAAAALRNAEMGYRRSQALYESGAISAADRDSSRETFDTTKAALDKARADLENSRQTLSAQIQQAEANLRKLNEVPYGDVRVSEAEVNHAISELNSAKADLEDFYVRVPVAGQILRVNTNVGERVNSDEGIVDLGQTDQMYVIAEVYETDVSRIQTGQRVTVTSENGGFDQELSGTVDHIGLQIQKTDVLNTDPAADQNARVVEVKIRLNPADSRKVAGLTYMQVRVKIHVD